MPAIKELLQRAAHIANAPLIQREALRTAFKDPPKDWKALPRYYVEHLRDVFSSPKKLRLAMTDLTPMGLAQTAMTIPATLALMKAMPERKAETLMGMTGNLLGGQVMQRTGLVGGLLGGLGGEILGRTLARPFTRRRESVPPPMSAALGNRLQRVRDTGQRIDDVLGMAQEKLGESMFGAGGADGMTQRNPTVTDAEFGGTSPRLQAIPGEQGNRESISGRGKTIGTGDTLFGDLTRMLGHGSAIESHRKGDPFGQHVDFDSIFEGPTVGVIPGEQTEPVKSRS